MAVTVVALNRAVALAEVDGPQAALRVVDALEGLDGYRYLHSTRADLLSRMGRHSPRPRPPIRPHSRCTDNTAERAFLADVRLSSRFLTPTQR